MRRFLSVGFMLAFCLASTAQAQLVVNNFDASAEGVFNLLGTGLDSTQGGKGYMHLSDDATDPFEGSASMTCDWRVHTTESWGGFLQLQYILPDTVAPMDFSGAEFISIMYKNSTPSSKPGSVNMRFKIHDGADGRANDQEWEDWYFETSVVYDDTVTGWQELLIPLKEIDNPVGTPPNDQGFSIPGWSGNGNGNKVLDLNNVIGYSIEWTAPQLNGDSLAAGVVSWDALKLKGHSKPVLSLFEDAENDTSYSFAGTGASSVTITNNTTDAFEGTSAQFDWVVDATESWGGFASATLNSDTLFADMLGFTHISLMYNNLVPSSVPGNVVLRVELHDYSDSETDPEVWYYQTSNVLESAAGWHQLLLPLEDLGMGTFPNDQGFSNPGWSGPPGNSKLDWDGIRDVVFEFSAATQGTNTTGTILFDNMELYGSRETDVTAPDAVQGLAVATTPFVNVVTWQDVPGEEGETYNIYYSEQPITDVSTAEVVALDIPENTRVAEHSLVYPKVDTDVSYFYAITAKDKAGNVSAVTSTPSATTNTAKGIVTISIAPPANFTADGDLSEWAGIDAFRMFPSEGAPIVTNTTVDDDADLSVLAYLALDDQYLYIAFDVTDDVTSPSVAPESWLNDAPDLYIGLYDWRGAPHSGYERGAQPDYHFRFNKGQAILDNLGGAVVMTSDSSDYAWVEKFVNGYTVETRIPLALIAQIGEDDVFSPAEGMRIPLDFSINDADGAPREGIMTFSPKNEDKSWQTPSRWVFTWLGSLANPVGVRENGSPVPFNYSLSQNYPNPFNPATTINFSLKKAGPVSIQIFNILGQKVMTLIDEYRPAGSHSIKLDASDLSSGVYIYRIKSGDFQATKKMVFMK